MMFRKKVGTVAVGLFAAAAVAAGTGLGAAGRPQVQPATAAPPPRQPIAFRIEPPDVLQVEVLEALPGRPINGERLVRPDGTISLGFYGDVPVAGLTLPEAKERVVLHLSKFLNDDVLGLEEYDEDEQPIKVAPKDSNRVFVEVSAYNSKFYYVLGDVESPGRLHVTGQETVLDALTLTGGLPRDPGSATVRLIRERPEDWTRRELPIDIEQLTRGSDWSTNYQLLPGDRLIVTAREASPSPSAEAGAGGEPELARLTRRMKSLERQLDQVLRLLKTQNPSRRPDPSDDPRRPGVSRDPGKADNGRPSDFPAERREASSLDDGPSRSDPDLQPEPVRNPG